LCSLAVLGWSAVSHQDFKVMLKSMRGNSQQDAGLRGLPAIYLAAIFRADGTELHAVAPNTCLKEGDSLWFSGSADAVASLRGFAGLEYEESSQAKKVVTTGGHSGLFQVVVAARSPLVGRTVRESSFRSCYNAAIIAVHRQVGNFPVCLMYIIFISALCMHLCANQCLLYWLGRASAC